MKTKVKEMQESDKRDISKTKTATNNRTTNANNSLLVRGKRHTKRMSEISNAGPVVSPVYMYICANPAPAVI